MRRRHAIIAGIFRPLPGYRHYTQKRQDSACKLILSVDYTSELLVAATASTVAGCVALHSATFVHRVGGGQARLTFSNQNTLSIVLRGTLMAGLILTSMRAAGVVSSCAASPSSRAMRLKLERYSSATCMACGKGGEGWREGETT